MQWQRTYGTVGKSTTISAVAPNRHGGCVLASSADSNRSGNKTCTGFGKYDGWLIKLDSKGVEEWQFCLGGEEEDILRSVQETTDGGFIVLGFSYSPAGGNKSSPLESKIGPDLWVVRLDLNHNILWDKSLGGVVGSVVCKQTRDGGFLVSAISDSQSNKIKTAPNFGFSDYWVIRLGQDGEVLWDASFGGTGEDIIFDFLETDEGGFILTGSSSSRPGGNKKARIWQSDEDMTEPAPDFWVVRIDSRGKKLWDHSYGGSGSDVCRAVVSAGDGGFFLGGSSGSDNFTHTASSFGSADFWLIKIDQEGNQVWDRSFGGEGPDDLTSVTRLPDGGLILAGMSESNRIGNKESLGFGQTDLWLVRTDSLGNKLWDAVYGGSLPEELHGVITLLNGTVMVGGSSQSPPSGNRTSVKYANTDGWVLALQGERADGAFRVCASSTSISSLARDGFLVRVAGPTNGIYALESSSDLQTWTGLGTNQPGTRPTELRDWSATNSPRAGFYRARKIE